MSITSMQYNRRIACILGLILTVLLIGSKGINPEGSTPQDKKEIIVQKAFPLFWYLQHTEQVKHIIQKHQKLNTLASNKKNKVIRVLENCKFVPCYTDPVKWSKDEIEKIGSELISLYKSNETFRNIISVLRDDGSYILYEDEADTTMLKKAWEQAARGVNFVLDVYLNGEDPRYPGIDSISYKVDHYGFINLVENKIDKLVRKSDEKDLFFDLPLRAALTALEINGRDEAARYEPLDEGYNEKPVDRIDEVAWDSYKYSVILVPGQGPQQYGVMLDSLAMHKMKLAAERFDKGMAPFFVVSGGHVHPYKTRFCEAIQMKKFMMEELGIEGKKIIIEPHARHTHTNLRNTTRLIHRFNIPFNKPVLVVTDTAQNRYINGRMGDRAHNELGYRPYKNMQKLNANATLFYLTKKSLHANPFEILDP